MEKLFFCYEINQLVNWYWEHFFTTRVKQQLASAVLEWETTWELLVMLVLVLDFDAAKSWVDNVETGPTVGGCIVQLASPGKESPSKPQWHCTCILHTLEESLVPLALLWV